MDKTDFREFIEQLIKATYPDNVTDIYIDEDFEGLAVTIKFIVNKQHYGIKRVFDYFDLKYDFLRNAKVTQIILEIANCIRRG